MTEKIIEWNLAFTLDEVVVGVEKLLSKLGYAFSRSHAAEEEIFHATPPRGALTCAAKPLTAYRSPFNIQVTLHRTLLTVSYSGLGEREEALLKQQMTLAFLRVGG